jgi:hypothetical protein
MKREFLIRYVFRLLPGLFFMLCLASCSKGQVSAQGRPSTETPAKVEVRSAGGRFQLWVNGQPFYVKGAGVEFGSQEQLAAHGGNAFRTWRTENGRETGRQVLDRARTNGLYVAMGLEVGSERHGFDYNDAAAVQRQLEQLEAEVLKFKDHPALLAWIIGNELNLNATNPQVWNAVNEISRMIHRVDPNHPTMSAVSGLNRDLVGQIQTRTPDLDLIGIQMYADIVNLPRYLKTCGWDRPYLVTEWGATGHWEVGQTAWGAPIENDSTVKADQYLQRFNAAIRSDPDHCLGSFVFLWGQKQERTPTWYGMFLETGEATAAVDVMHYLWNDQWPSNRCPRVKGIWFDGRTAQQNVRLTPGQSCIAKLAASDENGDPLTYHWEILEESRDLKVGGDAESKPQSITGVLAGSAQPEMALTVPSKPGAYRLFGYVFDGRGGAAHANLPFYVAASPQVASKDKQP